MKGEIWLLILHHVATIIGHQLELCRPGYYRCSGYDPMLSKYGLPKCIREELICDGVEDCEWNEDEQDCTLSSDLTSPGQQVNFLRSTPSMIAEMESTPAFITTHHNQGNRMSTVIADRNSVKSNIARTEEETMSISPNTVLTVTSWPYLNRGPKMSDESSSDSSWTYDSSKILDEPTNDTPWIYEVDQTFPEVSISDNPLSYDDSYELPEESSDDPFLIYDVSRPKFSDGSTSEPTWIYDVIANIPEKDDNITTMIEDSEAEDRTHIELVIAIMISILTVFFLVICVIFLNKLSRNKKRRNLSIGRRMRLKYGADDRFDISA